MDMQKILDQLLQQGKTLAQQGTDLAKQGLGKAEQALGIPESGVDRDKALKNIGIGAAGGGLLALLLGTKTGRNVGGKLLKYGSIAAVAALAYKAVQNWRTASPGSAVDSAPPADQLQGEAAAKRGTLLLRAMISAANADGRIDSAERAAIEGQLATLGPDVAKALSSELAKPLSADELAKQVDSTQAAAEVYAMSSLIVDDANPMEQGYLKRLATALKLPDEFVASVQTA